jgi:hypothetical protein
LRDMHWGNWGARYGRNRDRWRAEGSGVMRNVHGAAEIAGFTFSERQAQMAGPGGKEDRMRNVSWGG